jgi:hypothetical protein
MTDPIVQQELDRIAHLVKTLDIIYPKTPVARPVTFDVEYEYEGMTLTAVCVDQTEHADDACKAECLYLWANFGGRSPVHIRTNQVSGETLEDVERFAADQLQSEREFDPGDEADARYSERVQDRLDSMSNDEFDKYGLSGPL